MAGSPVVEILYFEGCPNHQGVLELVKQVARELRLEPAIEMVEVPDAETAARLRFLGSPTVRVDGRDVEPGAEQRATFVLACRVYQTEDGVSGRPDEQWIRRAVSEAAKVASTNGGVG